MKNEDITNMISCLMTAPSEATLVALEKQREIWSKWLEDIIKLMAKQKDETKKQAVIDRFISLAPSWKMRSHLDLSISMRVSSVDKKDGKFTLGLGIGSVNASGQFGFMSQSSSESTLQARLIYDLTNDDELTLEDYLKTIYQTDLTAKNIDTIQKELAI